MKKLNLVAGIFSLLVSAALLSAACLAGEINMWPDIVMTACMGILCITTALGK